jgi:hypothetical protein
MRTRPLGDAAETDRDLAVRHARTQRGSERPELARLAQHHVGSPVVDDLLNPRPRRLGVEPPEHLADDDGVRLARR